VMAFPRTDWFSRATARPVTPPGSSVWAAEWAPVRLPKPPSAVGLTPSSSRPQPRPRPGLRSVVSRRPRRRSVASSRRRPARMPRTWRSTRRLEACRSTVFGSPRRRNAVAALLQGKVDLQTIATLSQLAGTHEVVVGSFPQRGDGTRASGSGAAVLVTGLDGAPTSPAAVASTLTGLLQESLTVIAPSQITPGPEVSSCCGFRPCRTGAPPSHCGTTHSNDRPGPELFRPNSSAVRVTMPW
jgi:hypothetical protein